MALFNRKHKALPTPRVIEWRDGALRVREPLTRGHRTKGNWPLRAVRVAVLGVAWVGAIVGMGLFVWFFAYGVAALLP